MSIPTRIYIETTIVSYLTARPSKNSIQEGRRQVTVRWWAKRRLDFCAVISPVVLDEAGLGDPVAATARLTVLAPLPCWIWCQRHWSLLSV